MKAAWSTSVDLKSEMAPFGEEDFGLRGNAVAGKHVYQAGTGEG